MRPGAKFFLEQRKAQGLGDITDAQADALAALLAPIRVAVPQTSDAPSASNLVVGNDADDLSRRAS